MTIPSKIIRCAILISALMMGQAEASRVMPKRLNASQSRKAFEARQGHHSEPTPNKPAPIIIPGPGEKSVLDLFKGKPSQEHKFKEYTFKIVDTGTGTKRIAQVLKDNKEIAYTKEVHDSIQNQFDEETRQLITDNLIAE